MCRTRRLDFFFFTFTDFLFFRDFNEPVWLNKHIWKNPCLLESQLNQRTGIWGGKTSSEILQQIKHQTAGLSVLCLFFIVSGDGWVLLHRILCCHTCYPLVWSVQVTQTFESCYLSSGVDFLLISWFQVFYGEFCSFWLMEIIWRHHFKLNF